MNKLCASEACIKAIKKIEAFAKLSAQLKMELFHRLLDS